jgi:hypothetical protein
MVFPVRIKILAYFAAYRAMMPDKIFRYIPVGVALFKKAACLYALLDGQKLRMELFLLAIACFYIWPIQAFTLLFHAIIIERQKLAGSETGSFVAAGAPALAIAPYIGCISSDAYKLGRIRIAIAIF